MLLYYYKIFPIYIHMDTRFWGPDGWKLLHSIVHGYSDNPTIYQRKIYSKFLDCLKFVLPCIHCRNSFTEYTAILPPNLENKNTLTKWLYDIHNMVNDKLRKQGFLNEVDPEYHTIYKFYENYIRDINNNNCVNMPGWDFIYCVLFNYPEQFDQVRIVGYSTFIILLPYVLPFPKVKDVLMEFVEKCNLEQCLLSKKELQYLAYNMEKIVKESINCKCASFTEKCSYIDSFKAGCKKNKTCRINGGVTPLNIEHKV